MNKEDSEDGALSSPIRTTFSDHLAVIDLTGPDGNHLICTKFVAKLLPDDKENKSKQPLDTYLQFKGRGRYKLTKCVIVVGTNYPSTNLSP